MEEQYFDLAIIGGGPGGYVAAIRGAQLGLKTVLVERERLGGICLNWGCIPTKALLRSAEVYHHIKQAGCYGLKVSNVSFDLEQIVNRSRAVSAKLRQGITYLLKKNKVTVVYGVGSLERAGRLTVEKDATKTAINAKHIIVAAGARPMQLKCLESDGELVWTYKEAMVPKTVPRRLLVVGAGAIGVEFASFYNELGAEVTLVEALSQVLPGADEDISALLSKELSKQGVKIRTSTFLKGMHIEANGVTALLESSGKTEHITVERVLLATGVVGNTEGLGLENTKVKVTGGFIEVNEWMQTAEPGIHAIGDITGPPCLAHKASREGIICVERIAGFKNGHPVDRRMVPYCTYARPQVASIGLTEKQARENGYDCKVGKFPFSANGKAIALGETEGLVKTIFDAKTGELLGAHMIGAEVTEIIQGYGIAMNLESTEENLMQTIFPHPTLSEIMHEATLAAYGRAIHS